VIKVGIGFDVHQLASGEAFLIGGVRILSEVGSVGHSDGDALSHAIVDAILGAAGLGDIGSFFPSDDDSWKDAKSKIFLIDAIKKISDEGYIVNNIDSTIILEYPKINKYILDIKKGLSKTMGLDESKISIKATTTDRLGVIGEGLGWASMAVVSIIKKPE
tara:strand:+ start:549 stop:1031 length:483 start_codon:yes stop_codon:yes gene_type:complete